MPVLLYRSGLPHRGGISLQQETLSPHPSPFASAAQYSLWLRYFFSWIQGWDLCLRVSGMPLHRVLRTRAIAAQVLSQCAVQRRVSCMHSSQPMKFVFLLWITIRGTFDASVWGTAVWCILSYFTNVLWLQCFCVFIPIHFIWNMSSIEYVRTHTNQDCLFYLRLESTLVGFAIILALVTSIIPTLAAILFLSLLAAWTNLETHWLHTWLFVACVVYILARGSGKRKMASILARGRGRRRMAVPAERSVLV